MRTRVIINPTSGGGAAGRVWPQVEALLRRHGAAAEFVESRSTAHVAELAQGAAAAGCDVLAVLGGDGTFHHALNAAASTDVAFAFIPAGNGNDIARGLGLPLDPLQAALHFLRSRERAVDLPQARLADGTARYFLAAGGLGLDAVTADLVNGRFRRLPGAVRYVTAALWALRTFAPFALRVELDNGAPFRTGATLFAAVANGPVYGSGVCIAPDARMDDGWLELTLIPDLPLLRVLEALPIVLTSGNLRWPEVQRFRARQIRLAPEAAGIPLLFHGDGEVLGPAPLTISLAPHRLRVFAQV